MRGTVIAVDPTEKDVVVRTDAGAQRRLDAPYVAEHLQHAYALTAHTIQGATVEWAGVVGRPEDFTRNWSYTALSRAREPTELFVIDTPTERELDRTEIAPGQARGLRRRANARSSASRPPCVAATTRTSRSTASTPSAPVARPTSSPRTPAARRASARPSVVELQAELTQLRERIGRYPEHLVDQLHAARSARAEAQRVADERAGTHRRARATRPRRAAPPAPRTPPNARWSANASSSPRGKSRRPPSVSATSRAASPTARHGRPNAACSASAPPSSTRSSRPAAASTCASRSSDQLAYLTTALGALPDQPRARRTWQQAATRIEAYRFDHAVTDTRHALGSPPTDQRERAHWQRAHHDLQRAQRDLGHRNARQHSHEI